VVLPAPPFWFSRATIMAWSPAGLDPLPSCFGFQVWVPRLCATASNRQAQRPTACLQWQRRSQAPQRASGRTDCAGEPCKAWRGVRCCNPRRVRGFRSPEHLSPDPARLGGSALESVPPRFEDGFVARLAPSSAAPSSPAPTAAVSAVPASPPAITGEGPAIAVRDLVRRFGPFTAVDRVTFSVARGEIFGLLGPNGAGKSTTFRRLCGLLRPSAGEAHVAGQALLRASAAPPARIGYMAQRFSLYAELSTRENLRFFARVYGLDRTAQSRAIAEALDRFDLSAIADAPSRDLPLGLKQRLALAAALLHRPEILFLDEPTSGVDPLTRRDFWTRIGLLADAGVTILVTSHFMDEAEYCDRIGIVSQGRLRALGTPAE
ncbi:MAG: ABC transporter ATP-binding protein, partial [Rhodospirillales bacterium]|nr:ABC transporter ATP-binding protein [Rhodospirillales bacterium]